MQITRPFLIGQTEVTVGEWQQVMGSTPGDVDQENLPVPHVSWHDAVAFCEALSSLPEEKEQGRRYRLPMNAEWEYACRAGTTTRIWFGDDHELVEEYAWIGRNSAGRNHPVGLKPPNPWGLYDIRGNVHEWVSDWQADSRKPEPVDADGVVVDPQGPDHSPFGKRLVRGGSKLDNPNAFATEIEPTNRSNNIGFRVVAAIDKEPTRQDATTVEAPGDSTRQRAPSQHSCRQAAVSELLTRSGDRSPVVSAAWDRSAFSPSDQMARLWNERGAVRSWWTRIRPGLLRMAGDAGTGRRSRPHVRPERSRRPCDDCSRF